MAKCKLFANYIDIKKELHLLATLKSFISLFILFYWLYFNCCAKILLASSYPKFLQNRLILVLETLQKSAKAAEDVCLIEAIFFTRVLAI